MSKRFRPPYLAALNHHVLVFDGAMGTSLDQLALTDADYGGPATAGCRDYLALSRPDVITQVHRAFLDAGCDVIETCSFQASRLRLAEWGLGAQTYALNYRAAQLCRAVVDQYAARDGRPRFVAGSIGPTGKLPSLTDPLRNDVPFAALVATFTEQAGALIAGGVDVLLIETSQDLLEVKAAILGCKQALAAGRRPVALQVQVTLDHNGRMLLGSDIAGALTTITALGVDVVGLNCSTGPAEMREAITYLTRHSPVPVSCVPNAGIPQQVAGQALYPLAPAALAEQLGAFVRDLGVRVVGGCCGSTPEHMRAIADVVRRTTARHPQPTVRASLASSLRAVPLVPAARPLLVGTQLDSRRNDQAARLLLIDDQARLVELARSQSSVQALQLRVTLLGRTDEADRLARLVQALAPAVESPLLLASDELAALEAALQVYPGRPILHGPAAAFDATLSLAARYGALVFVPPDARALDAPPEEQLPAWRRNYERATRIHQLPPEALIIALPLGAALGANPPRRAAWTIAALRLLKHELPGVLTAVDLHGWAAQATKRGRTALNSVLLDHTAATGLNLALLAPDDHLLDGALPAAERTLCEELLFTQRADAPARFVAHYEALEADQGSAQDTAPSAVGTSIEQAIYRRVLERRREGIEALLDRALTTRTAEALLNDVLLPAMQDVGERYAAGTLVLPYVLQSAEVMKRAISHLEPCFAQRGGLSKGVLVLATVAGDVHDIGKNLVATILSNNGYTVYDLGKQVPMMAIIEKALEVQADAIGLSAMLISTSRQMALCVQELSRRGLRIPVLVGGASIGPRFAREIMADVADGPYAGGVFYCKDAFAGLTTMQHLINPAQRATLIAEVPAR